MRAASCLSLMAALALLAWGCHKEAGPSASAPAEPRAEHTAFHGGCLNAIGSCDNGHAEVKVQDAVLTLWLVGGGNDTGRAVRIPDSAITLSIKTTADQAARTIVLDAKPNALADEKVGDCATFEGQADWLKGMKEFSAAGAVTFKGQKQMLRIDYPQGYDPDDEPAAGPSASAPVKDNKGPK